MFDKGDSGADRIDGGQRILDIGFPALLGVALWQGKARAILSGSSINQMAIPQIASSLRDLLSHERETGQLETYKIRFGDAIKSLEDQLASLDDSSAQKIVIVVHMMDCPNDKPRIRMLLEKMQPHQIGARGQANRYLS